MTEIKCYWCDKPATWMRYTQFAGNHPFCDKHAEMETDFQPSLIVNDGDADWERLDDVLQEDAKRETNSLEN